MSKITEIARKYLYLSYDKIPVYIIDSIMEDILAGNGEEYSDEEIEKIVKALCYKRVSKYFPDFNIEILPCEELNKISKLNEVNGIIKENTIYLQKEHLLKLKFKNIGILRTIFHEVTHAAQRNMLENNEINYKTYLLIMEQIIVMEMNDEYYSDNYGYLFEEVDARINAEFELFGYLKEHAAHILDVEFDEILENIESCEKDFNVLFRIVNKKEFDREELFDRIMKRKTQYLEIFPILNFYYSSDGSKITLGEIILRDNEVPSNSADIKLCKKLKKLDSLIMKNRRGSRYNLERDIESLKKLRLTEEEQVEIQNLINYLTECLNNCMSGNNMIELYDSLLSKINKLRKKIQETKTITDEYSTKIYLMFNNIK